MFPFLEAGGQIGVEGVGKRGEKGSGAIKHVRGDAVKEVQVGDVADDPNVIAIKEHYFSGVVIGGAQIGLVVELIGVGNARSEIRR